MAIRPVAYKAVIKPVEVEERTKSGIVLAIDQGLEIRAQVLGTIVELGEDFAAAYSPKTPFWGLKKGDQIFYAKYAGKWVKDPDTNEELLIINDTDVCGVLRPDETSN